MARPVILYAAVTLTCMGALASACSGAETQDVLLGAASSTSSGSTGNGGTSGSTGNGGTSGTSGTSGGASGTSGGNGSCQPEEEPNDDKDEANELAPARCGTLSGRDDREFLTFRLKPDTRSMAINFTGRVRLRVNVAGRDTTELTPDNAGIVPFVPDADYLIEVRALTESNADVNWRVEVVEK